MKNNLSLAVAMSAAFTCGSAFAESNQNEKHIEKHVEKHVQTETNSKAMHSEKMQDEKMQREQKKTQQKLSQNVRDAVGDWPQKQQDLVQEMVNKYGEPSGVMASRVVWEEPSGPWNETIVYRDAVDHDFPIPHQDYLEQSVLYEVPADKMDELAKFDGSVIVYLTKGRLAARCDKEAANFLALNLAHDIITDKKTVQQARDAYADAVKRMKNGEEVALMQELNFEPMTADRASSSDETVVSL